MFNLYCSILSRIKSFGLLFWGLVCILPSFFPCWASSNLPRLQAQTPHSTIISEITYSPDGRQIVTVGGRLVRIWDAESGLLIRSLSEAEGNLNSIAISPDGSYLASASELGAVHVFNYQDGKLIRSFIDKQLENDRFGVKKIAFSPDGRLVAAGWNGYIKLWDVRSGRILRSVRVPGNGLLKSISFSPRNEEIAFGVMSGKAWIWSFKSNQALRSINTSDGDNGLIAYGPDGSFLAIGGRKFRFVNASTGLVLREARGVGRVDVLALCQSGDELIVGNALEPGLLAINKSARYQSVVFQDQVVPISGDEQKKMAHFGYAACSPNGKFVAGATKPNWNDESPYLVVWDLFTGREKYRIKSDGSNEGLDAFAIDISPDGEWLAVATGRKNFDLWGLRTGGLRVLGDGMGPMTSLSFDSSSKSLATGGADGTVRVWDLAKGEQVGRGPEAEPNSVSQVGFHPIENSLIWLNDYHELMVVREIDQFSDLEVLPLTLDSIKNWAESRKMALDMSRLRSTLKDLVQSGSIGNYSSRSGMFAALDRCGVFLSSPEKSMFGRAFIDGFRNIKDCPKAVALNPKGEGIAVAYESGYAWRILDVKTGAEVQSPETLGNVEALSFSLDGKILFSVSSDTGRIQLWDAVTGREIAMLQSFSDGSWVVTDSGGRYDSSESGENPNLHWVVGQTPIGIEQLKERYYDPGLLTKLLGTNKDPLRTVPPFDLASVKLPPLVELSRKADDDNTVLAQFQDEGGGIGRIRVRLNGKEILTDASSLLSIDSVSAAKASLSIPIPVERLQPGLNSLDVVAFNAENHIRSRLASIQFEAESISGRGVTSVRAKSESSGNDAPPTLFVIAMGVSRYAAPDERMNLQFSGKDAADLTQALLLGGQRLFGAGHVNAQLLTDASTDKVRAAVEGQATSPATTNVLQISSPTRAALQAAFANVAKQAKPTDIVVVSLAGHGVMTPSNGLDPGDYHYLTREAQSTDLSDPAVRSLWAVSSAELTEWIKAIKANKQVLVLDTCAAGGAVDKLIAKRDMPGSHKIALERLKDRTGFHILAGAAADRVSYEASRYGQGLLTYALLSGLRGAALREGEFADVSTLFQYAVDEVPKLAKGIGGLQSPLIASPKGSSFDIGRLTADEKVKVPLALVRPLVLRAQIQSDDFEDNLRLEARLNARLRMQNQNATRGGMIYVDAEDHPDGWRLRARYSKQEQGYLLVGVLFQGGQAKAKLQVPLKEDESGQIDDLMAALAPLVH